MPKPSTSAASWRSYGYQASVENTRCMTTPTPKTPTTARNETRLARTAASGRAWPRTTPASRATSSAKASGEKPNVANTARANASRLRRYWSSSSAMAQVAAPARNG